jgi:hypothetical protein
LVHWFWSSHITLAAALVPVQVPLLQWSLMVHGLSSSQVVVLGRMVPEHVPLA